MLDLVKVANVLDAAAEHLDAIESEKISSANAARQATIDTLAAKYAEATGEEMPDTIRKKLASSDKDVVELVRAMVTKQAGAVETLGSSSSRGDDSAPMTVKEAAEQADEHFRDWIIS
jgi:predicted extracellular nuclease